MYFCPICFPLPSSQHHALLLKHPTLRWTIDTKFEPRNYGLECVEDVIRHYEDMGEFALVYHVTKTNPYDFDPVDGLRQIEPRHPRGDEKTLFVWPSVQRQLRFRILY